MSNFKKLANLAKKDVKKSEDDGDDFAWIDDYLEESRHSDSEPEHSGYQGTRSMFDENYERGERKPYQREERKSSYGTYGGYNSGSYGSYGGGKSWWEREKEKKKPTYYSGGSGSVFGSSFTSGYTSASSDMKHSKELLDAKAFVSNLVTIHDPLTAKRVTTQVEGTARGIGNIFSAKTTIIPLLPEISTKFSLAFNKRLDILSGQGLMTSTINHSNIKDTIKKENENKIKEYSAKQANSETVLKTVNMIASMLSEQYVEEDIVNNSPGYENYIKSFRDYYYNERYEDGIKKHGEFLPIDLLYVKLRDPDKVEGLLEIASSRVGANKYETLKKVNEAIEKLLRHMKPGTENIFGNSVAILMSLLSSCVKDIEDVASAEVLLMDSTASQGAMEGIGMHRNLTETMDTRSLTTQESQSLSALAQLEEHDYSSYTMKDPTVSGYTHHKNFEMNFYTMKGDPNEYAIIRKGMDAYVNPLKRMMKFRDFVKTTTLTSQKRGKLDKGKLAMVNSTDRIYKKTFTDKSTNVSICLLVDESGSMSGPGIQAARAVACLFSEAFMGSKTVDLHVYGHTAQESYGSGPSCAIRKYPTKQSISDLRSRCQNLDGAAIYGTAQDFLKASSGEQKIMIVLSDGNPYGSGYSGSSAVNHTRECVEAVEKLGIIPMQVAIASHVNSDRMFKRWFKFTDMNKFIPEMGKMIKVILKG